MQKNLVYFEKWMDPVAEQIIGDAADIGLSRLVFDGPDDESWAGLEKANGYQAMPAMETPEKWYPNRAFVERCPDLLAISSTGAGYDIVDVDACTELGIMVVNNSGANSVSVAQHVLGLALTLSKRIAQTDKAYRRMEFVDRTEFVGSELTGKVIGIVGLGNIGRLIAGYAAVFGAKAIAYDPYITDADFTERGAEKADFETLCRSADIISVNCPKTTETTNMMDARAFGFMKPSVYFITTARGGIHDEDALVSALSENRIQGAGIDVFTEEPCGRDHPLTQFENVLLSPHNAGVTHECNYNMAKSAAEQWLMIFQGQRPPRLKNPEVWDRYCERYARVMGKAVAVE